MIQKFLLFVIAVLLVAIFWELCKINGRLKRSLSSTLGISGEDKPIMPILRKFWADDEGQDIAEYAVMLAVILVVVSERFDSLARMRTTPSPAYQARSSSD